MNIQDIEWCSPEYQQALELRHRILREPLGLSFTGDDLDAEHSDSHFAAIEGDAVVGVLIARPVDAASSELRQMAVDVDHQRQGIGTKLMRFVEKELESRGIETVMLHAREDALAFYERLGYVAEGDRFEEVGLAHLRMRKSL